MTDVLKFACTAKDCGRKFSTKDRLDSHILNRHPDLAKILKLVQTTNSNNNKEVKPTNVVDKRNSVTKAPSTNISINTTNSNNNKEVKSTNVVDKRNSVTKAPSTNISIGNKDQKINHSGSHKQIPPLKPETKAKISSIIVGKTTNNNPENNQEIKKENNKIKDIKENNKVLDNNIQDIKNIIKDNNKTNILKDINKNNTIKDNNNNNNIISKDNTNTNNLSSTKDNDNSTSTTKTNPIVIKDTNRPNSKEALKKEHIPIENKTTLEDKQKKILDNLYSQINSLENYYEKEGLEIQKKFELPEVPDYDKMLESDDEDKKDNKNDNKDKKTKEDEELENLDGLNKEEIQSEIDKKNALLNNLDIKTSKIIEITEDLIFGDSNLENYSDIVNLDLSHKNIASFMNKRQVDFEDLSELTTLNLSYNWLNHCYDIHFFTKLKILKLNDNRLEEISFCETLPLLEELDLENNEISSIAQLNTCTKLKILKLATNKICYLNSTLKTLQNLRKLEELTINHNKFIDELFAYKQFFISKLSCIFKLDNEQITDVDRDIASRFVRENNPLYKSAVNRPMSSRPVTNNKKGENELELNKNEQTNEDEDEDIYLDSKIGGKSDNNFNNFTMTQSDFRVGSTLLIKEAYVPYKGGKEPIKKEIKPEEKESTKGLDAKTKKILKDNENLKETIEELKKENDYLKLELENSAQLNKEYEAMIECYKSQIENFNNMKGNNPNMSGTLKASTNNSSNNNNVDMEKIKLKEELEMWKKEYCDLLDKTLNNQKQNSKENIINTALKKELPNILAVSQPNFDKMPRIERPQTATVRHNESTDFEQLCEQLKIMKSANKFADVLNENSDEEEEENENAIGENNNNDDNNENKNNKEEDIKEADNNNQKDDDLVEETPDNNDNDPDDDIDELFRKSYQNIQKMREDIKYMNENIDKQENIKKENGNINNSFNNKSNNSTQPITKGLKPVILKKDSAPPFIGILAGGFNKQNKQDNNNNFLGTGKYKLKLKN